MANADKPETANLRAKAEELLKKKLIKPVSLFSEVEMLKLIHELEVHQVELELQNEELMQSRMASQVAADKYIELYDFAPTGYFTLSPQGEILELNLQAANLLGKDRSGLKNSSFGFFISDEAKRDFTQFLDKVFKSQCRESCELALKVGRNMPTFVHLTAVATEGGTQCLLTAIDISQRKQSEAELRQSNELINLFLVHSPIYAFIKEVTPTYSKVLLASESFLDLTGIPGSQMIGKVMDDLFPAEFVAKMTADDWSVVASGQVLKLDEDLNGRNYTTIKFPILMGGKNLLAGYTIDITDRKRAEAALFESRERYKALIELAVDGILVGSKDGIIIEVNTCICEMTGRSRDELLGKHISTAFFSKDTLRKVPFRFDLLTKGEVVINERNITRPDGSEITVEMRTKMMPDNTYQSIYRDITARKQILEELRVNEEKFHTLFENMTQGVLYQLADGTISDINLAGLEIFGLSRDQVLGITSFDPHWKVVNEQGEILPPDQHPSMVALHTGKPAINYIVGVYNALQNSYRWLIVNAIPQFAPGETKPEKVFATMHDITERKLAEDALQNSEKHYRELADSITDVFFEMNQDLCFTYWNKASENLFGITSHKAIGKLFGDLFPATTARNQAEAIYRDVIQTHLFRTFEETYYFNNKEIIIEVHVYPSMNGIAVFATDITDRKIAEAEIKLRNEELQKSNAEKDKYFSVIAHDLRSPFNAFLGFTKMLEEDLPDLTLEETQKIAGSMRNSAIKQFHLLENLLEWSRMQRGLSFFKPEPHKLLDEIAASIELVLDAAEIKNIRIQYDIPEDLTVLADAQMLESIMRNLVFNAVKFTPNGGQITIAAKENAAHTVEISVSDTGIGMDQTIIDKLFSLNDQANRKGTNGEPSTGLGLMICKDYIEKLGDKLSVESAVGKGSTFWFSLPVDKTLKKG